MTSRRRGAAARPSVPGARRVALLLVAVTTGLATLLPGTAQAAPTAVTVAEAKAQIEQLETEAAALDQQYVAVKEQLDLGRAALAVKRADATAQAEKVAATRLQVGQVALAQFQNRSVDTAAQILFTSDTDNFLSQISTVEKISENQNTVLQTYQEQQARLSELELSTRTDLAQLAEQEAQLAELRSRSEAKISQAEAVLAQLSAAEQAALAQAEQEAAAQAQAAAEAAATTPVTTTETGGTAVEVVGTGRGAVALAWAKTQLGKPYRYGAAGPDAYDCSGLTLRAWADAGVSLPRVSSDQATTGMAVSRDQLQPGDLVFYYSPVSHVAIYAGNGQIIHAPHPGSTVSYASVDSMPWAGARRPG